MLLISWKDGGQKDSMNLTMPEGIVKRWASGFYLNFDK